jgi:hypothetical protein
MGRILLKNLLFAISLVMLFFYFQFSDSISDSLYAFFYQILIRKGPADFAKKLQDLSGYKVYHPMFWSKIVYSAGLIVLMVSALLAYTRTGRERVLSFGLIGIALILTLLVNAIGKVASNQWLETFSRDTFEFILSPLTVIFILPVLLLYRASRRMG